MLAPSQRPDLSMGGDARHGLQDAFLLWLTANTPDGAGSTANVAAEQGKNLLASAGE